jgi:hypothetical protein
LSTVEGAVFALFGLMMAFTFSGAASRFAEKRMLIADEVNCIETAYLRLHLLSQQAQPALRELFRRYVDSRLETYRRLPDMVAAKMEMANSKKIQEETWTAAVAATSLPPRIIYVLLFGLGLVCSLLAGYRMASGQHRSWLHILGFTGLTVIIVYIMLDIEYPRAGLIRLESADQLLVNLRESMK